MSSKLQNIKAIRQMLDGTHRTQTKKTFGIASYVEKTENQKREIGEVWIDSKGVEWEQRNGFKIKKSKLDSLRKLIVSNSMPSHCPKCNEAMLARLDKKFWLLEKHCFNCQVAFEHNLHIEGKFEEYAKKRMLSNAEAWLVDAEKEAKDIIEVFKNPQTFVNSDGTFEKWSGGKTPEEVAEQIQQEFEKFKTDFVDKLKTT